MGTAAWVRIILSFHLISHWQLNKMCESVLPARTKTYHYVSRCFKMCQDVPVRTSTYNNAPARTKTYQDASKRNSTCNTIGNLMYLDICSTLNFGFSLGLLFKVKFAANFDISFNTIELSSYQVEPDSFRSFHDARKSKFDI